MSQISSSAAALRAPAAPLALAALLCGALVIGLAGICVRWSETGPTATAFWRGLLALPLLAAWARLERRPGVAVVPWNWRFAFAGVCFAGDLTVWHWSLLLTSVAASTLEANLSPIFVTLAAWLLFRERPKARFVVALAVALAGLLLVMSPALSAGGAATAGGTAAAGRHSLIGDLLGIAASVFYAGYLLAVAKLRAGSGTGLVMFRSTLVYTILVLPLALTQKFLPDTAGGWLVLLALACIVHVLGQGLIAFALARLPATFRAVGLYVQPVAAAAYAWLLLGERLTPLQGAGAVVVLAGIGLARSAR